MNLKLKFFCHFFCTFFLLQTQALGEEQKNTFSGRVSRLNREAALIRFRIRFQNMKFLSKGDRVEFWTDASPTKRCSGQIMGKSNEYMLLKVPEFEKCLYSLQMTVGSHMYFYSSQLDKNLVVARELLDILLKKRIAIQGKLHHQEKELDRYVEKIDAINKRYEHLKKQLELEWEEELSALENDRLNSLKNFKGLEINLGEIDHKIEQYKVQDQNLEIDRWALDTRLYNKK